MITQLTLRHLLYGATLVSLLSTSVAATEVHLPNPRHTWGYGGGKVAYGTDETDDVLLMFECRSGGRIESTFLGLGSDPATQSKTETRASVIIRQHDGAELKVLGASQENLLSGEYDVAVTHDVAHPILSFFKQDGILELQGSSQSNGSTKRLVSLQGARQAIEQLQKSCSASTQSGGNVSSKASVEQSGSPDEQSAQPSVKALAASLRCDAPFKPEVILGNLQKEKVIGLKADDGGDGVPRFRSLKSLNLFGMRVITVSGWNYSGRMFSRAPGTAPPVHVGISVEGTEKAVADRLRQSGIHVGPYREGKPFLYVTDDPFISPKLVREYKGRNIVTIICSI